MKVEFGYEYKMYGKIEVDMPDGLSEEEIAQYLEENIDVYPLPDDSSYVEDSCLIDKESIEIL